ncbi:sigma-70 family RNA polymerase sigma factor [Lachnospiraceae bacterium OttesenSCG-928-D06]|nr:sigma-70 family RNA polymerase sigma factor [Lachnospiraceae bacterium OttesenSCG-928-D06]
MITLYLALIDEYDDKKRFEQLFHLFKQDIFHISYKILKDNHAAEDATQETFIYIARNIKKIDDIYSKKTKNFIYIIAKNRAIDIYRKRRDELPLHLDTYLEFQNYHDIDFEIIENEQIKAVAKVIASLPITYSRALELNLFYGLSRHEIADLLGISYNAVKLRILRGRKLLIKELRKRELYN